MAKMMSCECGWTLITPMGEADLKKHAMMHMSDAHPGMKMSDDMMMKMMNPV
jgi:predicted small metal-binding protein